MKIAILAWGSVVWKPDTLGEQLVPLKDRPKDDLYFERGGPKLPLEFSRISDDGRLTLVIDEQHGESVPTRFAISERDKLPEAVTDLWIREKHFTGEPSAAAARSKDDNIIGYTDRSGRDASFNAHPNHKFAYELIMPWLQKSDFEAVVWTALASNYKIKRQCGFSVDDAINYLKGLREGSRERAFRVYTKGA
jgi:hypothetical protein